MNMLTYNVAVVVWLGYSVAPSLAHRRRQSLADSALGTEPGRSSAPIADRFFDSDVRRHGGTGILAKLDFGAYGQPFSA